MENELLGIGRMASLSGLPISALRFYDGAGVLVPRVVDPCSGYRFYAPDQAGQARLVAHLRRVGLPVEALRTVLGDPGRAHEVLDAHLARLEAGLADARREISIVHALMNQEKTMYRCTLPATALVAALRQVRHAVSDDPAQPRLHGVLLDAEPAGLRVVATDRFRLATAIVPTPEELDLHLLLPTAVVDRLLDSRPVGDLEVCVADGQVTLSAAGFRTVAKLPDTDFPSYRSLLQPGDQRWTVDAAGMREELSTQEEDVARIRLDADGVRLGGGQDADAVMTVNRRFLLDALGDDDQLVLGFDDPIAPLAIGDLDGRRLSVIMPMRLDASA